jgi:hypothetical protein
VYAAGLEASTSSSTLGNDGYAILLVDHLATLMNPSTARSSDGGYAILLLDPLAAKPEVSIDLSTVRSDNDGICYSTGRFFSG